MFASDSHNCISPTLSPFSTFSRIRHNSQGLVCTSFTSFHSRGVEIPTRTDSCRLLAILEDSLPWQTHWFLECLFVSQSCSILADASRFFSSTRSSRGRSRFRGLLKTLYSFCALKKWILLVHLHLKILQKHIGISEIHSGFNETLLGVNQWRWNVAVSVPS